MSMKIQLNWIVIAAFFFIVIIGPMNFCIPAILRQVTPNKPQPAGYQHLLADERRQINHTALLIRKTAS